ncbi:MAG TPA: hypothetical protein ENN55_04490 [Firmicutes bacterium]|nr:hypothetical protein [Bacillota bacterium]
MTKKVKTREVEKGLYDNYLKKAREFMNAAESSLRQRDFNSTAASAIHAGISYVDALCVFSLKKRFAGEKHENVVNLVKTIPVLTVDLGYETRPPAD